MPDANSRAVPRLAVYGITTTLLTLGVVVAAFVQHDFYYTACVQLAQSSAAMMVLANMGLLITILLGKILVRVFFGHLRTIEVERLYEQGWLAVTETCLALAILRDEFDTATLALFVFLLFCKVFHWMLEYRVEFMEQQAQLSPLFLVRAVSLSSILSTVDVLMLAYAVSNTRQHGATMMIVFGFEFALLLVRFVAIAARFVLNVIDVTRGGEWDDKLTYSFYVDLLDDLAKLLVYLGFFFTLLRYYGFPIHILRELYITLRSFITRCGDWVRYRKAMQNMHGRYPTVSQPELDLMSDATCIICREEMLGPTQEQTDEWNRARQAGSTPAVPNDTPKRLPCSHVFHFNCLRSWLERQQSCPTCRQNVLDNASANSPAVPHVAREAEQQAQPQPGAPAEDNMPTADSTTIADVAAEESQPQAAASAAGAATAEEIQQPLPQSQSQQQQQQQQQNRTFTAQSAPSPQNRNVHIQLKANQTLIPIFKSLNSVHMPSLHEFPCPDLSTLSDEQIRRLDGDSRTAVEERIRILTAMQVQLSQMVVALTQVQSLDSQAPKSKRAESIADLHTKGKEPEL
ncbi:E3 ubiquitin-protein ligase hrd1 [Coemansia sp. RSA 2336]|nr:E3 ubiquitin-protein ligase hrd1 [Coemansia sp. RSA 2336]